MKLITTALSACLLLLLSFTAAAAQFNYKQPEFLQTAESGAYRASILYFVEDPSTTAAITDAVRYYADGLLIIKNGKVSDVGDYQQLIKKFEKKGESIKINQSYQGKLIMPGFIDTHIHFPQAEMIGAYGEQLLQWLDKYTFPTEKKYADKSYADSMAETFIDQLLSSGTTTALVFGSVHPESVNALFEQSERLNMRMIAGKVMMDRNAPDYLTDTAQSSYQESKTLIEKWHKKGRALYSITPRFAPTSTPEQLSLAGQLKAQYPTVYMHTHLSENLGEIKWVESLFPEAASYLDVYSQAGLTGRRSVFAHGIHLDETDFQELHDHGAAIAFCPTSNLFLGSGLFKLREAKQAQRPVRIGMGTDVGAGTSFSMLQTLNEAYKVVLLQQNGRDKIMALSAFEGFYQATLGGAKALYLDDKIGSLAPGHEADFIVLDWKATPLQTLRMNTIEEQKQDELAQLAEKLFALMMLGDDRNIAAAVVSGREVYKK
ncbi:guanine deaminase [Psychromonas aquimarina]|uniref:guanine deaminase n=1 Tax=Psychromonas aquimarina TaxID=444919 RepID=UPI00040C40AD|nr:guanine deaminase [Psychromonas aquimarina]